MDANTLEQTKKTIDTLDLEPIIHRTVTIDKWPRKYAEELAVSYRNFLYLKFKYGEKYSLPPSDEIDTMWHNHVLHTETYHRDCMKIFNKYLHHHPHHGDEGEISQTELERCFNEETQVFHYREFGDYIYQIRPGRLLSTFYKCINFFKYVFNNLFCEPFKIKKMAV